MSADVVSGRAVTAQTGLRWAAAGLWVAAFIQAARLAAFVMSAAFSDIPPQWGEAARHLDLGSSLLIGAAMLACAALLVWRAAAAEGRRAAVFGAAAGVLLLGQAGIWWAQQVEPLPELATAPDPEIPGMVAWAAGGDEETVCIRVAPASGGPAWDAYCEPAEYGMDFVSGGWSSDGHLALLRTGAIDLMLVYVDVDTGRIVDTFSGSWTSPAGFPSDRRQRADGAELVVDGRRVRIEVRDESATSVLTLRGPHDYAIKGAQWSPDGAWILAQDTAGRLIVVAADGGDPRVLVRGDHIFGPAWHVPGNPTYTISEPRLPSDDAWCSGYRELSLACAFDYGAYRGDLAKEAVRALLLVLDDQYLTASLLRMVDAPDTVAALVDDDTRSLGGIAAEHGVAGIDDPWDDPHLFGSPSASMVCVMAADVARSEGHLIEALSGIAAGSDLEEAFAAIDGHLPDLVSSLDACAYDAPG